MATATADIDHPITEFVRCSTSFLVGQDFCEAVNYTPRSNEDQGDWLGDDQISGLVLKNPISEDQTELRFSLLEGLMDTARLNQSRNTGATRFFETGRVFREVGGKILELISVAFLECGANAHRSWAEPLSDDFTKPRIRFLRSQDSLEVDLSRFRIGKVSRGLRLARWPCGCDLGGKSRILRNDGHAECEADSLQGHRWYFFWPASFCVLPERLKAAKRPKFEAFSLFPPSTKDLSLLADQAEQAGSISSAISKFAFKSTKGAFEVERVEVFDVYEGEGIPDGKKSVGVSITFRSKDRTFEG